MSDKARNKTGRRIAASAMLLALAGAGFAQELPKPTYANSIVISIEHSPADAAEVDYIKANLPFGLYAWPSFSVTHIDPDLAWNSDWTRADAGIAAFKTTVDSYIAAAKAKGVKFHLVVCAGLARGIGIYADAKTEDIRNTQWFNDNNIGTAAQVADPDLMSKYVFGTFSRYARKLQANLAAKSRAAFAFLKQRMDENPETFIAVSGWGETEMSFRRINNASSIQDYFCDYSPFAVLEFRDWITHEGLYDDAVGLYHGEGWTGGGAKYRGSAGLALFNADFGTAFTSWNLRYYNWSLADDWDAVPQDGVNTDPRRIALASYAQEGMRPASGSAFIAGGFDPPRQMTPGNSYYDLWNLFRETMVRNLLRDAARRAQEAGIGPDHWYSHQIPGDYLFGTKPDDPLLNPRYYSSAAPLRTADLAPYGSAGATIYDIKFLTWFARTSKYIFPAISAMSPNWAIMEYDPETYPSGQNVPESSSDFILQQFLGAYSYAPHLINFWRWIDAPEHRIKGMNKEIALREFIRRVRDKARAKNLNTVYSPPKVIGLTGAYGVFPAGAFSGAMTAGGEQPLSAAVRLEVTGKIWTGETWKWKDWGDFHHFEIFRGGDATFTADTAHSVGTTAEYVFNDATAAYGGVYYYKWRAVNVNGVKGPASDAVMVTTTAATVPVLSLSKKALVFGQAEGGTATPGQSVLVKNIGAIGTTIAWTAVSNRTWLLVSPAGGTGNGILQVGVNGAGLTPGPYTGRITVNDPLAANAPQYIDVQFVLYAAGGDAAPIGAIDTPAEEAGVSSSIPVTGWALDDVGVDRVTIKRYPVGGDPPAMIDKVDGLVFIGEAVFVKGARPDIEDIHPTYPRADSAGWGYMLLTNFLPNQGNGTFKLVAVAADTTGHTRPLGTKTIHVDNLTAVKPFGAIDTPTQGGIASGSVFYNFGWVLTPLPNYIPYDGSTIWVWVDGVPLGHPSYGHYRDDVATLFPGYLNSRGAVGVFNLNTTNYADGMHNIAWGVTDSAGHQDGIGSRFFEIRNIPARAEVRGGFTENAALLPESEGSGFTIETGAPQEIEIEELGRVKIKFTGTAGTKIVGWAGTEEKPLPIGSTLDETGTFWWAAGPGFLGRQVLHFAATDGFTRSRAIEIVVTIVPKGMKKDGDRNKAAPKRDR